MSILVAVAHLVGLVVAFSWMRRAAKHRQAMEDKLERWNTGWQEQRRWLAEFPDVVAALNHLKAHVDGRVGGADIYRTREQMRARLGYSDAMKCSAFVLQGTGPVTAKAAAARESDFRIKPSELSFAVSAGMVRPSDESPE